MSYMPFTTNDGVVIDIGDVYWYVIKYCYFNSATPHEIKYKYYHTVFATSQDFKKGLAQFSTEEKAIHYLKTL